MAEDKDNKMLGTQVRVTNSNELVVEKVEVELYEIKKSKKANSDWDGFGNQPKTVRS